MGSADAGCQEEPQGRRAEQHSSSSAPSKLGHFNHPEPRQSKQPVCSQNSTDIVISTIKDSVEDHNGVCFHAPSPFEII